jgi:hypothetical protein
MKRTYDKAFNLKNNLDESGYAQHFYVYDNKRSCLISNLKHQSNNNNKASYAISDSFQKLVGLKPTNSIRLFDMCMSFIADNLNLVESLIGFPSLIGELIFEASLKLDKFNSNILSEETVKLFLRLFAEAYPDEFCSSLNLSNRGEAMLTFLQPIISISSVKFLNLSNCHLKKLNDKVNLSQLLESSSGSLQFLDISKNDLDVEFLRLFTLKHRLKLTNFTKLESINLAYNAQLNISNLEFLCTLTKYPNLNEITISSNQSDIIDKTSLKKYCFDLCTCEKIQEKNSMIYDCWFNKINLDNMLTTSKASIKG